LPYDTEKDLDPVLFIGTAPYLIATGAMKPYRTLAEVIAAAKAQPGRLSVATPGNGSVNQIVLEWMALNTDTKFQHIPYKGGAPAAASLAGGDIPLGILASSSAGPHVKSGRVRVLAVTMAKRSRFSPDWPTLQEAGVKEVDASNWTALYAPKGTPQPIIDKLNAEVVKILNMPDVKERFAAGGVETIPSSAAALDARTRQEAERFKLIVQKANIRPD
jgi:tripartite-type tricarboxylate transporter receptor subunit TctC